ncbi:MAG: hypothetical protein JXM73_06280, partial [Anaerolineae bacterium]|nr:hypothetical protein [Anaerolineae bacterium]
GLAPTTAGNYRLRYASPAIDSGNTLSVTVTTDLDGNLRVVGDEVDMGAYEFQAYTLTVSLVGNGQVVRAPDQPAYTYLDQVALTATADPGWTFTGWSGDVLTTTNPLTLTIMGHTAVTATFIADEYTLDVTIVGEGAVSKDPDQPTYHYGDVITLTAIPDPSWTFVGWSGDIVSSTNPLVFTITKNTVITATFSTYRIYLPFVIRGGH